jgi:ClpP class serine protease
MLRCLVNHYVKFRYQISDKIKSHRELSDDERDFISQSAKIAYREFAEKVVVSRNISAKLFSEVSA